MRRPRRARPIRSVAALLSVLVLAWLAQRAGLGTIEGSAGTERIARAFAERESGFMVTVEAEVEKLLSEDRDAIPRAAIQAFFSRSTDGGSSRPLAVGGRAGGRALYAPNGPQEGTEAAAQAIGRQHRPA